MCAIRLSVPAESPDISNRIVAMWRGDEFRVTTLTQVMMRTPTIIGFLIGGVVVGPGGLNLISELVQVPVAVVHGKRRGGQLQG